MQLLYEELVYETKGPVARLTLNRPAKLNAITQKLYRDKDLAKRWYHNLSRLVHPDTVQNVKAQEAMTKLSEDCA